MTSVCIGVIAEDESDFEVLTLIVRKIKNRKYSFKKSLGKGHGRIAAKCNAWSKNLKDRGCKHLILLHDADGKDPLKLQRVLKKALEPCSIGSSVIVVAVQELEAWLLSDYEAIHKVFAASNNSPNGIASPEMITDPKAYLKHHIEREYRKKYFNSLDNKKIADHLDVNKIAAKCVSFRELHTFIRSIN